MEPGGLAKIAVSFSLPKNPIRSPSGSDTKGLGSPLERVPRPMNNPSFSIPLLSRTAQASANSYLGLISFR